MTRISTFLIVLTAVACVKKAPPAAQTEHVFEQTSVARPIPLGDCTKAAEGYKDYPKATEYVQNMVRRLIRRNTESGSNVFTAKIDGSKICAVVAEDSSPGAYAYPDTGLIVVATSLLENADEPGVAATLAHELAHLTLNNVGSFEYQLPRVTDPEERSQAERIQTDAKILRALVNDSFNSVLVQPGFLSNPDVISVMEKFQDDDDGAEIARAKELRSVILEKKICGESCGPWELGMKSYIDRLNQFWDAQNKLLSILKKYLSREELANQFEADSDEIGLEFFARAGYAPASYTSFLSWYWENCEDEEGEGVAGCRAKTLADVRRGSKHHPALCWRILNLEQREIPEHAKDYERFGNPPAEPLVNPSLADAKASLSARD